MRGKEGFQTKDLAVQERPDCFRLHKVYAGGPCPSCELKIPTGPYTSGQMEEFFGQQLYNGQRRSDEPDPADVANPPTERELDLERLHGAATKRYNEALVGLARAEGFLAHRTGMTHAPAGVDPDAQQAALDERAIAEAEVESLHRQLLRERADRRDRIKGWHIENGRRAMAARR